jgi:hypothetical protein
MDNHQLEQRVAALEEQLAALKKTCQMAYERDSIRMLKTELDVEAIQDQLKEYDLVHAAAFCGYFATHPQVMQDLAKVEDILGTMPPEFKNRPTEP